MNLAAAVYDCVPVLCCFPDKLSAPTLLTMSRLLHFTTTTNLSRFIYACFCVVFFTLCIGKMQFDIMRDTGISSVDQSQWNML